MGFVEFPRLILVGHCLREAGAGGSNPLTPTIYFPYFCSSSVSPNSLGTNFSELDLILMLRASVLAPATIFSEYGSLEASLLRVRHH